MSEARAVLRALAEGRIDVEEALSRLPLGPIAPGAGSAAAPGAPPDLRIDRARERRTGVPEVVFAEGKSVEQVVRAVAEIETLGRGALATRVSGAQAEALRERFPSGCFHEPARVFELARPADAAPPVARGATLAVVAAGTSDVAVAEEAAITASHLGAVVRRVYDVGVAGLPRLLGELEALETADAVLVVAGMEGALPSVVAGLVPGPVVAVPTSVGYGASYGGLAALLAMLNSCAPGVVVVNVDNGFGAAVAACKLAARRTGGER